MKQTITDRATIARREKRKAMLLKQAELLKAAPQDLQDILTLYNCYKADIYLGVYHRDNLDDLIMVRQLKDGFPELPIEGTDGVITDPDELVYDFLYRLRPKGAR